MIKRMTIMLVLVVLVLGAVFGFQAFKAVMIKRFFATRSAPPETVSAMRAAKEAWQPRIEAVGSLTAANGTDVAPEVPGVVAKIHFESGQEVQAGALLVELDTSVDRAQLASFKATAALAEKSYERAQHLLAIHAISQKDMDTAAANVDSSRAQVAAQEAVLQKKLIRAPFAGRLGIRAVNVGQYLNPGAKIVTLQALDPIFVDFSLPQKSIGQISVGLPVEVTSDSIAGQVFAGRISASDSMVDPSTRNIKVRARIDNPKHLLLPGMFVTTDINVGQPREFVTLPQTSVAFNPYGSIVFLVEEGKPGADGKSPLTVLQKFVSTGETRGDQVAILDGVKPGDMVVTSGQLKLRNGTPVVINNTIEPTNNPAPTPTDR
jgi:membrane fusion protein, multidrug efflux system